MLGAYRRGSMKQQYAGFWFRLISHIIDTAIITTVASGLSLLLFITSAPEWLYTFLLMVIVWLYYALMESSSHQGTVGKLAVGLRVTDLKGKQISFGKATARYFGKYVSAAIFLIGFLMILFTKQRQALHDILARCLVLRRD